MANEITNTMLLEHMQEMKEDLQNQIIGLQGQIIGVDTRIEGLDNRVEGLGNRIDNLDKKIIILKEEMHSGFEDASQHRQALQEDLEASMRILGKHETKLVRL